jgi:hypothetical protein
MLRIPHTDEMIPANSLPTEPTRAPEAWTGMPLTVELYRPLEVLRVSASRLGLVGDWFALGDWIQTRSEYRRTRALPRNFIYQGVATLRPGTVVNVGICSPLFGHSGGGLQAEFLDGPLPPVHPLDGVWIDAEGSA